MRGYLAASRLVNRNSQWLVPRRFLVVAIMRLRDGGCELQVSLVETRVRRDFSFVLTSVVPAPGAGGGPIGFVPRSNVPPGMPRESLNETLTAANLPKPLLYVVTGSKQTIVEKQLTNIEQKKKTKKKEKKKKKKKRRRWRLETSP